MRVLYVDDERPAVVRFKTLAARIDGMGDIAAFTSAAEALEYAGRERVDLAFLDIEMPGMNGIELAGRLKELNPGVCIVFVTAYDSYALAAFSVDAADYLLKPYGIDKLRHALEKAARMAAPPKKRVAVKTFGGFDVFVDGKLVPLTRSKPKELLALLIDRRGGTVTPGMAIACLWEDRPANENTGALYRMTGKRLREALAAAGIERLLSGDGYRAVDTDAFDCDYYDLLAGKPGAAEAYSGDYLPDYAWAEETNARLSGGNAFY